MRKTYENPLLTVIEVDEIDCTSKSFNTVGNGDLDNKNDDEVKF